MFIRIVIVLLFALPAVAQQLPVRWDELVASDWAKALELSKRTCLLNVGILEKHGPHLPIGSDLIAGQANAQEAAKREYVVVFPEYYWGEIYEAKHEPGAVALPPQLLSELLQATVDEIARNGFKKIFIYSSHGGNPHWLRFFVQTQLEKRRDYVLYLYEPKPDPEFLEKYRKMRKTPMEGDEHAGERETSGMLAIRPDLVKMERAATEDGSDQNRLSSLKRSGTALSQSVGDFFIADGWYARFPNHYAGVGAAASIEEGKFVREYSLNRLVQAIRDVKNDQATPKLQEENFNRQLK